MRLLNRWWPLLAVAVLLAAAGASASMTRLPLSQVVLGDRGAEVTATSEPTIPPTAVPSEAAVVSSGLTVPSWVLPVLVGIAVAVGVVVLVALVLGSNLGAGSRFHRRALRRRRPEQRVVAQSEIDADVVAAVEAGLSELDVAQTDPRRAIIACWVRLERAASAAGTERLRGDTATDLVLRLLKKHHLSEPVLTGFADVYLEARFAARHEVDERMREQAKTALSRLRGELTGVSA